MRKLLILFAILVLSNCFNYKEELWINEDLSGKIKMSFQLGDLFSSFITDSSATSQFFSPGKSFKDIKSISGVTLLDTQIIKKDNKVTIVSEFSFKNITDVNKLKDFISQSDFFPPVELQENQPGLWTLSRKFTSKKSSDTSEQLDEAAEQMAASMAGAMFGDMATEYRVHIKRPVFRSNADSTVAGKEYTTFFWHYAISESFTGDHTLYIAFAKQPLKAIKSSGKQIGYIWPKILAADSLTNVIGKNRLTWGKIDSIHTLAYTPGITNINDKNTFCNRVYSLQITYDKDNRISYGEIVPCTSIYDLSVHDAIPLISKKNKIVTVISNYSNFLGWRIQKDTTQKNGYTLKQLK